MGGLYLEMSLLLGSTDWPVGLPVSRRDIPPFFAAIV